MSGQKHVLITGVSTGIGFDALRFLIGKGYYVFGSVRKAEDVSRLNQQFPENFSCLQFDVTKIDDIKVAYAQVEKELAGKPLNGLINNAGLAVGGPIAVMDDEQFRYQMEVNLFAVRNVTNIFLPLLKGGRKNNIKGGKIIMISSISGIFNTPLLGAYCISKHALESLADVYRRELMIYDIDVVCIQPGPIKSSIWKKDITQYDEYLDTDYGYLMDKMSRMVQSSERKALPAEVISKLIFRILNKRTRAHIVVIRNWLPTLLFVKLMPSRWVDRIMYKQVFR